MNPADIMRLMGAKKTLEKNHPKFIQFMRVMTKRGIQEGSVIEMSFTTPDGEKVTSNMKVQKSDIDAMKLLFSLVQREK